MHDKTHVVENALNKIRFREENLLEEDKTSENTGNKIYKKHIGFYHERLNSFNKGFTEATQDLSEENKNKLKNVSREAHDTTSSILEEARQQQEKIRRAGFGK